MKKGQIFGQPFVFLFYAIVAILVLFFGAKLIGDFMSLSSDVEVKDFAIKFRDKVTDAYYDNSGSSVSFQTLSVPDEIREVCVIDFANSPNFESITIQGFKDLMKLKSSNTKENVYFYGEDIKGNFESIYVENLRTDAQNPVCGTVSNGKLNMRAVNKGNYVQIISE